MRELAVTQVTPASASELKRVLTELEPLPVPALTMRWRGRASGKVLDGRIEVEMATAAGGETAVTCRYRFTGPLSWLIADDEYERLRGNLQYIGAVVCHRAEQRSGARCDGHLPRPAKPAGPRRERLPRTRPQVVHLPRAGRQTAAKSGAHPAGAQGDGRLQVRAGGETSDDSLPAL